eukprot:scaffold3801_cov75-Attheya_sp.AAC.2
MAALMPMVAGFMDLYNVLTSQGSLPSDLGGMHVASSSPTDVATLLARLNALETAEVHSMKSHAAISSMGAHHAALTVAATPSVDLTVMHQDVSRVQADLNNQFGATRLLKVQMGAVLLSHGTASHLRRTPRLLLGLLQIRRMEATPNVSLPSRCPARRPWTIVLIAHLVWLAEFSMGSFNRELSTCDGVLPLDAWMLVATIVRQIFRDLRKVRAIAQEAGSYTDPHRKTETFLLWATLQAHQIMKEYISTSFCGHPSVAPVLNMPLFAHWTTLCQHLRNHWNV